MHVFIRLLVTVALEMSEHVALFASFISVNITMHRCVHGEHPSVHKKKQRVLVTCIWSWTFNINTKDSENSSHKNKQHYLEKNNFLKFYSKI